MKIHSRKEQLRKVCFGTKEWSKNSGICKRCTLKESCEKANVKRSY